MRICAQVFLLNHQVIYVNPFLVEIKIKHAHAHTCMDKEAKKKGKNTRIKYFFILLKFNNTAINLYLKRADDNSNFRKTAKK